MNLIYKLLIAFAVVGCMVNGNPFSSPEVVSPPIRGPVKVQGLDGKEVNMNINPNLKFLFFDFFNNLFCYDACQFRSPGGKRLEWNNKSPADALCDTDCLCRNKVPVAQAPAKSLCDLDKKRNDCDDIECSTPCNALCTGKLNSSLPIDKLGYHHPYNRGACYDGDCYCISRVHELGFAYTSADGNHL